MIAEPWKTLLFLLVIPGVVQLIKIFKEKSGSEFSKNAAQIVALVISAIFTVISGGLAAIPLPAVPDLNFGVDFVAALGELLEFLGLWASYIASVWVVIMGLYEAVLEKLFLLIGYATRGAKRRAEMRKLA